MLAVAEPSGVPIASDVLSGEKADDPLYLPLIERVRCILLGQRGLLYTGDSKLASFSNRTAIVAHQDYYLSVQSRASITDEEWEQWLGAIIEGEETATLIWQEGRLLGAGYEFSRTFTIDDEWEPLSWTERVQVVRSREQAQRQEKQLEKRLQAAETALYQLTPPPGRGRRQYREETRLRQAIDTLLQQHQVTDLLTVTWEREETKKTRHVGRGRPTPNRPTRTDVKVRYFVTAVQRDEQAIKQHRYRLGWRSYVTNLPAEQYSLTDTVCHYRAGYCVERDFHLIKDRPFGLSPLYVQRDDQIIGLTHFLTIGLRLLTLIEAKVRHSLQQSETTLSGLYEGQPNRTTDRPSGFRLLRAFARAEISRVGLQLPDDHWHWHLSPLSGLLFQILTLLGLSEQVYLQLGNSP
jgi:transposase